MYVPGMLQGSFETVITVQQPTTGPGDPQEETSEGTSCMVDVEAVAPDPLTNPNRYTFIVHNEGCGDENDIRVTPALGSTLMTLLSNVSYWYRSVR